MVAKIGVVADEADALREWLDALDPLRFHFDLIATAATRSDVTRILQVVGPDVWLCRAGLAESVKDLLWGATPQPQRTIVVCSSAEEAAEFVGAEGVDGVVLDTDSLWTFTAAVHSSRARQDFLSPAVIGHFREEIMGAIRSPETDILETLRPREIEVLLNLTRGLSNTEIADRLFVSRATVSTHLLSIFRKIGVFNRTEAAVFAIRNEAALRRLGHDASTTAE